MFIFIICQMAAGYVDDGREIFDDDPNEIPVPSKNFLLRKIVMLRWI